MLVLVGVVVFVVGCFLPYYSVQGAPEIDFTPSFFELQTSRQTARGTFGSVLFLFSGAAAVAVVASVGIARPRAWAAVATVSMAIVWGLTWMGLLLAGGSFFSPAKEIGYWLLLVGVGIVMIGAIVVVLAHRMSGWERESSVETRALPD